MEGKMVTHRSSNMKVSGLIHGMGGTMLLRT